MEASHHQVILVTGSTSGIGLATAKLLAQRGFSVAVTGLDQDQCDQAVEEMTALGGTALGIGCDITRQSEIDRLAESVNRAFGRIDVLVNNAGWWGNKPFVEMERADFRSWFCDYMESLYFLSQRVARDMIAKRIQGGIVNIASTAGLYGERGMSAYCAAKSAVMNLTRAMALELGEYGIRVNCVAPGTTARPNESRPKEVMEAFRVFSPLGRLNTTEDIASAIAFLCGDESRGMTGHVMVVDAGFSSVMMPEKLYQK